jgi:hypothetical protein
MKDTLSPQTALDRRPGHLKDDPVKGPFPKAVCTLTIVVCTGAHGIRNGACAACRVPASVCNGTDSMDGVSYCVCNVTQAWDALHTGIAVLQTAFVALQTSSEPSNSTGVKGWL